MTSQRSFKFWLAALLIPAFAWAFLHKVWVGRFFLGADNTDFFYWFIYYFKNILNGVFPLWNPFENWGCLDYLDTQYLGVCNPLSIIIPVLLFLGVKAYWAYAAYLIAFWMMGFTGFFFLLNRIYNEPPIAWLGTGLLMFSGGLADFISWDFPGLYIFAPLGWFFGFLIGFVRSSDDPALKKNLIGLGFSCMLLAHVYLPFYFLTFFGSFLVSVLFFSRKWLTQFFAALTRAFKRMPLVLLFCVVSILFSLWPTADCYLKMKDHQNISRILRGEDENKTGNAMAVSQQMIDIGGLPSRATFSEFFSSYETGEQYLSFVPLMLFIFVLITLINPSSGIQRVIFMTGFILCLITITNVCPLQHFLYKHMYFFRIFRDYFFFWILFWSCFVVYVMGEIDQFLKLEITSNKRKVLYAAWIVLVHACAVIYLMSLDDVPEVSYLTVMASCLWFLARLFKVLRLRTGLFIIGLLFIGLWQPFYALPFIKGVNNSQLDYPPIEQGFSYLRPVFGSGYNEDNAQSHRMKYFKDASGFVVNGFMGQEGAYLLRENLSQAELSDYVRHKFILYDQTSLIQAGHINWGTVRKTVTFENLSALIFDRSGVGLVNGLKPSSPTIITGPNPDFKVVHFDVNSIDLSVNLDRQRFLVYNDSYHADWHVLVDQKPAKLYQANIAFKGVWIEKGRHLIRFYFGSWIDELRGWGVPLLFLFWFFGVIAVFLS